MLLSYSDTQMEWINAVLKIFLSYVWLSGLCAPVELLALYIVEYVCTSCSPDEGCCCWNMLVIHIAEEQLNWFHCSSLICTLEELRMCNASSVVFYSFWFSEAPKWLDITKSKGTFRFTIYYDIGLILVVLTFEVWVCLKRSSSDKVLSDHVSVQKCLELLATLQGQVRNLLW